MLHHGVSLTIDSRLVDTWILQMHFYHHTVLEAVALQLICKNTKLYAQAGMMLSVHNYTCMYLL